MVGVARLPLYGDNGSFAQGRFTLKVASQYVCTCVTSAQIEESGRTYSEDTEKAVAEIRNLETVGTVSRLASL